MAYKHTITQLFRLTRIFSLREHRFHSALETSLKVAFSSSSSENLGFHDDILRAYLGSNLFRFFSGPGHSKTRNGDSFVFEQSVADILVNIQKSSLFELGLFRSSST